MAAHCWATETGVGGGPAAQSHRKSGGHRRLPPPPHTSPEHPGNLPVLCKCGGALPPSLSGSFPSQPPKTALSFHRLWVPWGGQVAAGLALEAGRAGEVSGGWATLRGWRKGPSDFLSSFLGKHAYNTISFLRGIALEIANAMYCLISRSCLCLVLRGSHQPPAVIIYSAAGLSINDPLGFQHLVPWKVRGSSTPLQGLHVLH